MENDKEIWKDIEGYEGLYQISNMGRVKSCCRTIIRSNNITQTFCSKIRAITLTGNGYASIMLSKNGKNQIFLVHRLVARAFIPNPDNLPEINHKDENKLNNCVDNLEWCAHYYNQTYGTKIKRQSEKVSKKILQFTENGKLIKVWASAKEAGKELGIKNYRVSNDEHIWNLILINGKWVHLDATWDDPISIQNITSYEYFLVDTNKLISLFASKTGIEPLSVNLPF